MNPQPVALAPEDHPDRTRTAAFGLALLALLLGGLFWYKWGGAATAVAGAWSSRVWSRPADGLTAARPLASSLFYMGRIWIALVYGLLIGAAVRAFVSPARLAALLTAGGAARRQAMAAGTGAPLMLCSCCITPVFTAVYESGARLGSALAVMLASPALNPAALILTFILFPPRLGVVRLAFALVAVLMVPLAVEGLVPNARRPAAPRPAATTTPMQAASANVVVRFGRSLGYMSLATIPLIIVGVLGSALVVQANASLRPADTVVGIVVAATFTLLLSLPTFFELPIALIAFHAGAPGIAAVILVAGPVVNLPSLLIVSREAGLKVSLALAAGCWLLAVAAGLVA